MIIFIITIIIPFVSETDDFLYFMRICEKNLGLKMFRATSSINLLDVGNEVNTWKSEFQKSSIPSTRQLPVQSWVLV